MTVRALILSACLLGPGAALACDPARVQQGIDEVRAAKTPELARATAATALSQACRFLPGVADMMKALPSATAAETGKIDLRAAMDTAEGWKAACKGGDATLQKARALSGAERNRVLWTECDLGRLKLGTQTGFERADGAVYLAILAANHLDEHGIADPVRNPLLFALAGIGGSATGGGPTDAWTQARDAAAAVTALAWNDLTEAQWAVKAADLLGRCEALRSRPVPERQKNRQVEFDVCAQAGRAAENANAPAPPLFQVVAGQTVNRGFYLAATVAKGDPGMLSRMPDETLRGSIAWYVQQIDAAALPVTPP